MNSQRRDEAVTLEILEAIEARSDVTQRGLARRCGVALGLANLYLKRCVRKGLVKVSQAPANRYLYYLTPQGLTEKSRLTAQYLSYSLAYYRRAGESFARLFEEVSAKGGTAVGLYGVSELAEVATIRAIDHEISVVAVCDPGADAARFLRLPLVLVPSEARDAQFWILTALNTPERALRALIADLGSPARVLVPDILGLREH